MKLCTPEELIRTRRPGTIESRQTAHHVRQAALRDKIAGASERAQDQAMDRQIATLNALSALPAPTVAHLLQKVEIITADVGTVDEDHLPNVIADLRRLAGEA